VPPSFTPDRARASLLRREARKARTHARAAKNIFAVRRAPARIPLWERAEKLATKTVKRLFVNSPRQRHAPVFPLNSPFFELRVTIFAPPRPRAPLVHEKITIICGKIR
jgi:hypothetical protein